MSFFLLQLAVFVEPAFAARRLALVVGNDNYKNVTQLVKAVNDARAIGETLNGQGFEVTIEENVDRRGMNRIVQRFVSTLQPGDDAVFFYAGHGIEISGRNFLLPTDIPSAKPGEEDFIKSEAIPVARILRQITAAGTRATIMVLDACRNNPFPPAGTRSLGGSRGFASMLPAEGTFIMYSAGVGQAALDRLSEDDAHPNSIFTRSLIPLLKSPGMSLTQTARRVRRDVKKLASTVSHEQRPAYYDEITGDFFFAGRGPKTASGTDTSPSVSPATTKQQASSGESEAAGAWQAVKDSTSVGDYMIIIESFPDTFYARLAKNRIDELKKKSEQASNREEKTALNLVPLQKQDSRENPGLTLQKPEPVPATEQWYFATYHDLDLFGGDINRKGRRASSIKACASQCGRESSCKAFTYNSGTNRCFMKSSYQHAQKFGGALTGLIFKATDPENAPRFNAIWEVFAKSDISGVSLGSVRARSFATCTQACNQTSGCTGFSYRHYGGRKVCKLKGGNFLDPQYTRAARRGMTSARRINDTVSASSTDLFSSRD